MPDNRPKVFISHSSVDKPVARKILSRLEANNINVWLDDKDIKLGDPILDSIEEGLEASDYCLALISNNSVNSGWVKKELRMAVNKEIEVDKAFILPIKIDDCMVPKFLQTKKYVTLNKSRSNLEEIAASVIDAVFVGEFKKDDFELGDLEKLSTSELVEKFSDVGLIGRKAVLQEAISRNNPVFVFPFLNQIGIDLVVFYAYYNKSAQETLAAYFVLISANLTQISSLFLLGCLCSNSDKDEPIFNLDSFVANQAVKSIGQNHDLVINFAVSVLGYQNVKHILDHAAKSTLAEFTTGCVIALSHVLEKLKMFEEGSGYQDLKFRVQNSSNVNGMFVDFSYKQFRDFENSYSRFEEEKLDEELGGQEDEVHSDKELTLMMLAGIVSMKKPESEESFEQDLENWENLKTEGSLRHRMWMKLRSGTKYMPDKRSEEEKRIEEVKTVYSQRYFDNVFDLV